MDHTSFDIYGQLTNLLDAFTFLLASYNSSKGIVEYIRVYENGNRIAEGVSYSINKRETLATYSILNNEVIHISESEEVDNYVNRNITYDGVPHESIIYIPIVFQGEILGVFSVQSQKKNAYTKYHVEVMKTIGAYLGVAFNNSLSHSQLKVINELGQEITAKTDPIDVLYVAYDRLSEVVELNGFGIGVHNSITNSIEYPGFIEAGEVLKSGSQSLEIKTPSTYCFINQQIIHVNNLEELNFYKENKSSGAIDGAICKSIIYIPVTLGEERLGVATMQSFKENAFSDNHVKLFSNLCSYIAVAIDNSKSYTTLSTLSEIGKTITSTFNMKVIAKTLMESLTRMMELESFIFGTYNSRTEEANIIAMTIVPLTIVGITTLASIGFVSPTPPNKYR